jgi:hypothetical protein
MKLFDETTTEKRFYIPREVKEKNLLDDRYKKRSKLAYILHQIIYLSTFAPGYWERDFVPLYSKSLLKILGRRYRKYLDWLIGQDIIVEGKKGSTTSHRSNEYALAPEYRDDWTYWMCQDEDLIRRIREYTYEQKDAHLFWKSQPYIHLRRGLEKTDIDALNAQVWIERQDLTDGQKRYYRECVQNIHEGTNTVSLNPTNGRVQTPITSMAKELRSFLRLDGHSRLVELDITNSQPFFLALLVAECVSGLGGTKDGEQHEARSTYVLHPQNKDTQGGYITDAREGRIYERIAEENGLTREEAKSRCFEVLFSHPTHYQDRKKQFASVYPEVFNFCVDYKRKHGYRQLSVRLQQMEAEMMEEVCLQLHRRDTDVLTVFDSIIVKGEDAEEAREVFGNAFGGLEPEIETEDRSSQRPAGVGANALRECPETAESGAELKSEAAPTSK